MKKTLITLFILIIYTPMILWGIYVLTGKKLDVELSGYFDEVETPVLTVDQFSTGQFQNTFTGWLDASFLPRAVFIKNYNTMQYHLFQQGNRIIGKGADIFEPAYIEAELCIGKDNDYSIPEKRQELAYYVSQLSEINEKLQEIGKFLYVYVTPNKAHFHYPAIPSAYLLQAQAEGVRCVDLFAELIQETDVPYFNSESMADLLQYPAFYSSGIHWSRTFEQEVSRELIAELAATASKDYRNFELLEAESSEEPYSRDDDVFELLNIWDPLNVECFYQYVTERQYPQAFDKLKILLQGGSFAQGLRSDILEHYPDEEIFYVNYCNYLLDNQAGYFEIHDSWDELVLQECLDQVDGVVIEINEAVLHEYSNGFAAYLNAYLDTYVPEEREVPAMEKLDISDPEGWEEQALDGFYGREENMIWMPDYGTVTLRDEKIAEQGVDIVCELPTELFVLHPQVTMYVYINGQRVYTDVFCGAWQGTIHISTGEELAAASQSDLYEITICTDASFTPEEVGLSEDTRELAVQVYYVGAAR